MLVPLNSYLQPTLSLQPRQRQVLSSRQPQETVDKTAAGRAAISKALAADPTAVPVSVQYSADGGTGVNS